MSSALAMESGGLPEEMGVAPQVRIDGGLVQLLSLAHSQSWITCTGVKAVNGIDEMVDDASDGQFRLETSPLTVRRRLGTTRGGNGGSGKKS